MPQTPQPPIRRPPAPETPVPPAENAPTISQLRSPPPTPAASECGNTFPPDALELLHDVGLGSAPPEVTDTGFLSPPPSVGPDVPGYDLLDELGHGGMGVVYKARQARLNRTVALKMLGGRTRVGPAETTRFLAEAEAVAAVEHPNVVEVYDSGTVPGPTGPQPFYVMEFIGGGSLAGWLVARGPLSPTEAAGLVAAVAHGLHAAHEAGIVHRDVKPANILLAPVKSARPGVHTTQVVAGPTPNSSGSAPTGPPSGSLSITDTNLRITDFRPKITDFGLAKRVASNLTHTQAVMGTPAYMAPEQASGKAKFVGPAADTYALGVVLFECLTGRTPFEDEDAWGLIQKVLGDPVPSPRKTARWLPRDLELICLKCLAKHPKDRYATTADLADDLEAFLAGRPVVARPIPAAVRFCRWVRRRPTAAGLIALVAIVVLVGPAVVVWYNARLNATAIAHADAEQMTAVQEQLTAQARNAQADAERLAAVQEQLANEANKGKIAAEELATTRELFGLENSIRRRLSERPPGWTRENRKDLARAAGLVVADPHTRARFRSSAAATLLAPDLLPAGAVTPGLTANAAAAAVTPDGPVVALGEYKAWGAFELLSGRVRLIDPTTGKTVRDLAFPAVTVAGGGGSRAQDGVRALVFSPDGTRLFVGTRSGRVHRFDLKDRRVTRPAQTWTVPAGAIDHLTVSPDGRTVYGVCRGEPGHRWDAETGERTAFSAAPPGVWSLAVDPVTGDVVAGDGERLLRFDRTTTNPNTTGPAEPGATVRRLAFLPGGRALVTARGDSVWVVDPRSLQATARLTDPDLGPAGHEDLVTALAVHPSGAFVASAGDDRRVKVWELASGRLVGSTTVPGAGPVVITWSPCGWYLFASASNRTLRFEFTVPEAARSALHFPRSVRTATFGNDGKTVCGLGEGSDLGQWLFLAGDTDTIPAPGPPDGGPPGLVMMPGTGRYVVARAATGLDRWTPPPADDHHCLTPMPARCPRVSLDGSAVWAIVDDSTVAVWGTHIGFRCGTWDNSGSRIATGLSTVESLALGRTFAAVGCRDGFVHLLSNRAVRRASFAQLGDPVLSVAVSPNDGLVAAGTRAGVVRLMRPNEETELPGFTAHPGGVAALAFAPNGSVLVTGGKDRAVRVWRAAGDKFELVFAVTDLPAPVAALEFAPAGDELLVLLTNERAVRVWNLGRLREQAAELNLGW